MVTLQAEESSETKNSRGKKTLLDMAKIFLRLCLQIQGLNMIGNTSMNGMSIGVDKLFGHFWKIDDGRVERCCCKLLDENVLVAESGKKDILDLFIDPEEVVFSSSIELHCHLPRNHNILHEKINEISAQSHAILDLHDVKSKTIQSAMECAESFSSIGLLIQTI